MKTSVATVALLASALVFTLPNSGHATEALASNKTLNADHDWPAGTIADQLAADTTKKF